MDNLEEMDKFLEKYNFAKLNQEEIGNLNRPISLRKAGSWVTQDHRGRTEGQRSQQH